MVSGLRNSIQRLTNKEVNRRTRTDSVRCGAQVKRDVSKWTNKVNHGQKSYLSVVDQETKAFS